MYIQLGNSFLIFLGISTLVIHPILDKRTYIQTDNSVYNYVLSCTLHSSLLELLNYLFYLFLQELYELAQRKFHHQITQYALTQDTGLPYPRLFIVDVQKEKGKCFDDFSIHIS